MADKKIKARLIFEILGRPPEHILETLNKFLDILAEQKGVEVKEKKVHEPKLLEKDDVKDLYTTFAEVEVEILDLNTLFMLVMHMLPANVEIMEPENFIIKNFEMNEVLGFLTSKLHQYDELAKAYLFQKNNSDKELAELKEKLKKYEGEKDENSKSKESDKKDKALDKK